MKQAIVLQITILFFQKMFMKKVFYFLLLFLANYFTALSQDSIERNGKTLLYKFTLSSGIGKGYPSFRTDFGVGAGLDVGIEYGSWSSSIGLKVLSDFEIVNRTKGKNYVSNFDVLFGRSVNLRFLTLNLSTGLSKLTFFERDNLIREYAEGSGLFNLYSEYSLSKYKTFGLPVSLKIISIAENTIGFGLEFYANINKKAKFYGINICIQGKLGYKKRKIHNHRSIIS